MLAWLDKLAVKFIAAVIALAVMVSATAGTIWLAIWAVKGLLNILGVAL
jgi:hypothetical protein